MKKYIFFLIGMLCLSVFGIESRIQITPDEVLDTDFRNIMGTYTNVSGCKDIWYAIDSIPALPDSFWRNQNYQKGCITTVV